MKIYFENKSKDLSAEITFKDKSIVQLLPSSSKAFNISDGIVTFSVKYVRDFTFGYEVVSKYDSKITEQIAEKLAKKTISSIGNTVVQIVNTYRVSGLKEGAVIEVNDRAHYLSAEGIEALFGCFPALYYFGQAECRTGKTEILYSAPFNRPAFISLYKFVYRTINLHGFFFNIIKYKVQIDRQRKISSPEYMTLKFRKLYDLSIGEREYQFKPLTVLTDKFFSFVKGMLPKRVYNKLVRRFKRYFNIR